MSPSDTSGPLLSAAEVAELLGISKGHVNRLARTRALPVAQRLGTGRRAAYGFRRIDVEQFAAEHLPVPPIHRRPPAEAVAS
ncbi:helix-turn-helix domain-containing protein [uncultured Microbacterium sp.]|uniref:helix-turn-helix domain-containing protein n=1 Tax=uncultured Microbacterium sp. TaxID=191216 RepID=UPI0025E46E56|nr:helix-turn-helix domain-containing protein [uncultured Microbacterium sp.]